MDAMEMFWTNITPSITRDASSLPGLKQPMAFPRDCINVLRCRPFTFVQRVAGPKWHHNRTIIIGDAAHVFPPFGGQGIASGVRDAVGLSWRLAMLTKLPLPVTAADTLLDQWFSERRAGVDHSTDTTMACGKLTNQKWTVLRYAQAAIGTILLQSPWLLLQISKSVFRDDEGYKAAKSGFFLHEYQGGGKTSQVYVRQGSTGKIVRSDVMVSAAHPLLTVMIIVRNDEPSDLVSETRKIVAGIDVNPMIISMKSICVFDTTGNHAVSELPTYSPCTHSQLENEGIVPFAGYDEATFLRRFGNAAKIAVVRSDNIIFSLCKSVEELRKCLERLKDMVS